MKHLLCVLVLYLLITTTIYSAPFHDLIQNGEIDSVKSTLTLNPELLNSVDEGGYLPIHYAAYFNQPELAELFLSSGADLNARSGSGSSPLHGAAYYGHTEMVLWLINNGADINAQNDRGWPPSFSAAFSETRETLDILLQNGADISLGDERNAQLIHYLSWKGDTERVLKLIDMGVDINQQLDELDTPVIWAAEAGNLELYDSLISRGADITVVNDEGRSIVHYLARHGEADRMNKVIKVGLNADLPDSSGQTPLFFAMGSGDIATIKSLVELGVNINHRTHSGEIPLTNAFGSDSLGTFEFLLSNGADVNAKLWEAGNTPLLISLFWDRPDHTKILLKHGADPNIPNINGNTPLFEAINKGNSDIVELLLISGADPNAVETHYGHSPLHKAAIKGDPVSVELLLSHDAKLSLKDKDGFSPIDYAAKYHQNTVETYLASKGGKSTIKIKKNSRISKQLSDGEMVVWYLGHCGYGIKTSNHFLVFDYWKDGCTSADPCLENGFITPEQIKDENLLVFATHEHGDHYDSSTWEWAEEAKSIQYIYGFQPENMVRMEPESMFAAYEGPEYIYTAPRTTIEIDDIRITTIDANDAGVGFVVDVDGVVLFHAGDHAGWNEGGRDDYLAEIDYIAENVEWVDMAFVNVTGCHTHCEIALREGLFYTLDTLKPRSWSPTHAGGREYAYTEFLEMDECEEWRKKVACPSNPGDSYFYSNGKLVDVDFSLIR